MNAGKDELEMCLGVPGKVLAVDGLRACVDFWGVRRDVRLDVVDQPVQPGDYILNHVGFAIRRISTEDVQATFDLYEALLRFGVPDEPMASDVGSELEAATAVRRARES